MEKATMKRLSLCFVLLLAGLCSGCGRYTIPLDVKHDIPAGTSIQEDDLFTGAGSIELLVPEDVVTVDDISKVVGHKTKIALHPGRRFDFSDIE